MTNQIITNQNHKKSLGQFFTTNCDYILQGFEQFIKNKIVSDPFAGNQDLIKWAINNNCQSAQGFDYDQKWVDNKNVFFNDSLNNPQEYQFVCTNPPYLHKNKATKNIKETFFANENSYYEDLYQIAVNSCMQSSEGIMIVPLNFLCAKNSAKIREKFFSKFKIIKLNIFATQVFDDTTYNVISFYYKIKNYDEEINKIDATIFPQSQKLTINLSKKSNWQFGGDFLKKVLSTKNNLGIYRLTEDNIENGNNSIDIAIENLNKKTQLTVSKNFIDILKKNILFLRAIDSKNGKKIQLEDIREYKVEGLVGKNTSRNMAHLIFKKPLSIEKQQKIMNIFNETLNDNRQKYSSFFLTNFRDNNRKRLSFDFAYKLINLIYEENEIKQFELF
jgi:hypothetical protein